MTWHKVMKANWKKDRTAMKVVKGKMMMEIRSRRTTSS